MGRNPTGQWKKGESGNPAGRKPGTGKVTALRAALAEKLPEVIKRLVERALEGDTAAARLILERVIPPMKAAEEPAPVAMPDGSLTDQGRAVLIAISTGDLAPAQGAAILSALGNLAKLAETDDLAHRIAALEERTAFRGGK